MTEVDKKYDIFNINSTARHPNKNKIQCFVVPKTIKKKFMSEKHN